MKNKTATLPPIKKSENPSTKNDSPGILSFERWQKKKDKTSIIRNKPNNYSFNSYLPNNKLLKNHSKSTTPIKRRNKQSHKGWFSPKKYRTSQFVSLNEPKLIDQRPKTTEPSPKKPERSIKKKKRNQKPTPLPYDKPLLKYAGIKVYPMTQQEYWLKEQLKDVSSQLLENQNIQLIKRRKLKQMKPWTSRFEWKKRLAIKYEAFKLFCSSLKYHAPVTNRWEDVYNICEANEISNFPFIMLSPPLIDGRVTERVLVSYLKKLVAYKDYEKFVLSRRYTIQKDTVPNALQAILKFLKAHAERYTKLLLNGVPLSSVDTELAEDICGDHLKVPLLYDKMCIDHACPKQDMMVFKWAILRPRGFLYLIMSPTIMMYYRVHARDLSSNRDFDWHFRYVLTSNDHLIHGTGRLLGEVALMNDPNFDLNRLRRHCTTKVHAPPDEMDKVVESATQQFIEADRQKRLKEVNYDSEEEREDEELAVTGEETLEQLMDSLFAKKDLQRKRQKELSKSRSTLTFNPSSDF